MKQKRKTSRAFRWIGGILAGSVALAILIPKEDQSEETSMLTDLEAKIDDSAVVQMTKSDYSDTFERLGSDAFDRANGLAKWPAVTAAASKRCDKVEIAAVSDKATSNNLQWFVDCANGERFQITEKEAVQTRDSFAGTQTVTTDKAVAPDPQSAVFDDLSEAEIVSKCDIAVQSAMKSQSSFDTAFNWQFSKDASSGRVQVVRDFEAKNAFGAALSSQYRCVVDVVAMSLVNLEIREPTGWKTLHSQ